MSTTTWHGIAVALDRLQAADVDPAPIGDLLVLVGFANMLGVDVTRLLCSAGWEPPPDNKYTSAAGAFLRYTARVAEALSNEREALSVSACVLPIERQRESPREEPAAWELPAERPRPRIPLTDGLQAQVREALEEVAANVAAEARERWPGGESEGGEG